MSGKKAKSKAAKPAKKKSSTASESSSSSKSSSTSTNSKPASKPKTKRQQVKKAVPPYLLFDEGQDEKTFQQGLESAMGLLKGRKNIVVLCGAGISVSCGIPDFRSKGGIYDQIDINDYGLCTPEEIFHMEVFMDNPKPFYKFARKMLYPAQPHEPSPSHRFLKHLEDKKMLLRIYTQNIDGLEERAGISSSKVVYAHGSLNTSVCLKCGGKVSAELLREEVLQGNVPYCQKVTGRRKRKRNELIPEGEDPEAKVPVLCGGVLKPTITFFGEPLVDRVNRCLEADQAKADAVIVIGTSLSVAPISKVIKYLRPSIPRLLINRTVVIPKHTDGEAIVEHGLEEHEKDHRDSYLFDAVMLGFCDEVTKALTFVLTNEKKVETDTKKKRNGKKKPSLLFPFQSQDCEMLCNQTEKVEIVGDKCLLNHPADRVIMFSGAKLEVHADEEESYHEVVHCDECHKIISSTIYSCTECFDYDLCSRCHKKVMKNKSHCEGKHSFIAEKA